MRRTRFKIGIDIGTAIRRDFIGNDRETRMKNAVAVSVNLNGWWGRGDRLALERGEVAPRPDRILDRLLFWKFRVLTAAEEPGEGRQLLPADPAKTRYLRADRPTSR